MAKGPSPQPWQIAQSATLPPGSKQPVPAPGPSQTGGARPASELLRAAADAAPLPPPPAPVIPTDPKLFQKYLNDHFNAGLKVDGIIGAKTLAAAAKFGVAVPTPAPATAPVTPASPPSTEQPAPATQQQQQPMSAAAAQVPGAPDIAAIVAQMKGQYGYLGSLLDHPDIAAVLTNAVEEGTPIGDPSITAALMSTPTMQGLGKNQVGFDVAAPGEQRALVDFAQNAIAKQAKTLGVDIAPDRLAQIARDAARNGWGAGSAELSNAVAAEFHYTPGGQHGQLGVAESQIKSLASQYFLPLSDTTLAQLDQQVATGTFTPDDFKSYAIAQAKSLYNNDQITGLLDKGMTMDQIADPYRQDAANELGVNPDTVDFSKPQWIRALSHTDAKTGVTGMMSRFDWLNTLRTDPQYGWDRTPNGVKAGYNVVNALASAFGVTH